MLGKPKAKARPKPPAELPLCDPDFPDFRDPSLEEGSMLDRPPGGLKWGSNGVNQLLQTRFILGCTRGLLGRESRHTGIPHRDEVCCRRGPNPMLLAAGVLSLSRGGVIN